MYFGSPAVPAHGFEAPTTTSLTTILSSPVHGTTVSNVSVKILSNLYVRDVEPSPFKVPLPSKILNVTVAFWGGFPEKVKLFLSLEIAEGLTLILVISKSQSPGIAFPVPQPTCPLGVLNAALFKLTFIVIAL